MITKYFSKTTSLKARKSERIKYEYNMSTFSNRTKRFLTKQIVNTNLLIRIRISHIQARKNFFY